VVDNKRLTGTLGEGPGRNERQGPAGSQGKEGLQGKQGEPGKTGENGKNGTTGFTETLPSGKTLKGDWSLTQLASSETFVSTGVSFGIPLAEAPVPRLVTAKGKELAVNQPGTSTQEVTPVNCLGSAAEPKANPGNLCVYVHVEKNLVSPQGRPAPAICPLGSGGGVAECPFGTAMKNWGVDRSGFGLWRRSRKSPQK
jgi:hypothetical protein